MILTIGILLSVKEGTKAQPGWSVNVGNYNYSMSVTGVVNLNYVESRDTNDIVGAFVGTECRGMAKLIYQPAVDRYIAYLLVYSNANAETMTFKVYDASENAIDSIPKPMDYVIDGIQGTTENPYVWSNPTLSSESEILTYTLAGQTLPTVIHNNIIAVEMSTGTDAGSLIAEFTTSTDAQVTVGSVMQTSGTTSINFNNADIIYDVKSADESSSNAYQIQYSEQTDTSYYINEFLQIGTEIATVYPARLQTNLTYSLLDGDGFFDITEDGVLYTTDDLNYETNDFHNLTVKIEDGVFAESVLVRVNVLNQEEQKIKSVNLITPNGDGYNDYWEVEDLHLYTDCDFTILNNIGETVYSSTGYSNDWRAIHMSTGKNLPSGTYYYFVKCPACNDCNYTGFISVIR